MKEIEIKTTIQIYSESTNQSFEEDIKWTQNLNKNKQWVSLESLKEYFRREWSIAESTKNFLEKIKNHQKWLEEQYNKYEEKKK